MPNLLSGFILAGGASRRMGQDKALLELDGRPLVLHVVERLRPVCRRVVVVAGATPERLAGLGLDVIPDPQAGLGPIGGLQAGLRLLEDADHGFFTSCDAPFLQPALVGALAARLGDGDAVAPVVGGWPQPLTAIYRRALLPVVKARIADGDRSLIGLLRDPRVRTCWVEEEEVRAADPALDSFVNLNTPEAFARAASLSRGRSASGARTPSTPAPRPR